MLILTFNAQLILTSENTYIYNFYATAMCQQVGNVALLLMTELNHKRKPAISGIFTFSLILLDTFLLLTAQP